MSRRCLMAHFVCNIVLVQLSMCQLSAGSTPATQGECLEGSCPSQGRSQIQINSHVPPLENIQESSSREATHSTVTKRELTKREHLELELYKKTCSCAFNQDGSVNESVFDDEGWRQWQAARDKRAQQFKYHTTQDKECVYDEATQTQNCYNRSWDILVKDNCFDLCWNTFDCPCMVTQACRCLLDSCRTCWYCNSSIPDGYTGKNTTIGSVTVRASLNPYGPEYDAGDASQGESSQHKCPLWKVADIGEGFDQEDIDRANCKDDDTSSPPGCDGHVNPDPFATPEWIKTHSDYKMEDHQAYNPYANGSQDGYTAPDAKA